MMSADRVAGRSLATCIPPPESLIRFLPIAGTRHEQLIADTRQSVRDILTGDSDRLLVVIGPCSIHDPAAAMEYARRLKAVRERFTGTLEIVMRVYFEKPRTTVGWKGLINDPYLDGSFRIEEGLLAARKLLMDINAIGVPAGTEFLDVISPQYIGDLISWGAIGARTTESQVHRELASGLSAPIGFKNGTDGNIRIASDAIQAAARGHHFLSVHKNGQVAIVQTNGNRDCHVILRGGKVPNYDAASVEAACKDLEAADLPPALMVDCSHANSSKQHQKQIDVAKDIAAQIASGSKRVFGVMIESHLQAGAQKFTPGKDQRSGLEYGKSITDACIGWEDSVQVLETLSFAVQARRSGRSLESWLLERPAEMDLADGTIIYSGATAAGSSTMLPLPASIDAFTRSRVADVCGQPAGTLAPAIQHTQGVANALHTAA